jgi:hypothetical protein
VSRARENSRSSPQRLLRPWASPAYGRCEQYDFLFHRCFGLADRDALEEIVPQKCVEATEPVVLKSVAEFMDNQRPVATTVPAEEDAVTRRELGLSPSRKHRKTQMNAR